jgi:DNA-binding transcriptional ArsR family regulator
MSSRGADDPELVWKALADATRRRVLDLVSVRRRTTGELCEAFPDLCRTNVMKHLDILVEANLVLVRREGRLRWNYINAVPIQRICERWTSRHTAGLASSMLGLQRQVEGRPSARDKRRHEKEDSK